MVKVLAQEMKTVGVKNFTVHTCTLLTLLQYMYMVKKISRENVSGTTLLQHLHVSTSVSTLSSMTSH